MKLKQMRLHKLSAWKIWKTSERDSREFFIRYPCMAALPVQSGQITHGSQRGPISPVFTGHGAQRATIFPLLLLAIFSP